MKYLYCFLVIVLSGCAFAAPMDLKKGANRAGIPESISSAMWDAEGGPYIAESVIESEEEGKYYWLFRSPSLGLFDIEQNTNIGGWPLTRWEHEWIEEEVEARFDRLGSVRDYDDLGVNSTRRVGCLSQSPLRYGDIDEDGQEELVLFLATQMIFFSPSVGKTVFTMNVFVDDWMTEEETQRYFEFYPPYGRDDLTPHYQSAANPDYAEELAGLRGYGKAYIGSYDGDDKRDIVVWRKLYRSNMLDQPKGFTLIKNSYRHYEQSPTGEYLAQDTEPEVIQGWLSSNDLTWSDGFPRVSECEGEEGELIPEMHDPLLNDPEVLQ